MSRPVEPYRIAIPEDELTELRDRLARTRWPDPGTVDDWSQGVPLDYVRELAAYWADGYDWRAAEARMNAYPQFRTEIGGLGVHFLHARSPHPGALPLLLLHGWPGTFAEFLDVVGPLTDPADPADAFHVVCPSLPGYGFGDRPTAPGWGVERIAETFAELMSRLGYERFAAHGGDWGSFVTAQLAHHVPGRLAGVHVTMAFAGPPEDAPPLTEADRAGLARLEEFRRTGSAYAAVQSTRPQTLGYGLTDSPAGQLAWIAEKYAEWTDHDGDPEKAVPRDRLLDTASVYWFTATATSSARLYWESYADGPAHPVPVPSGVTVFPRDARMPRAWVESRFTGLRHWCDAGSGGHFPAIERPDFLVDELRGFFHPLR
ncbi:epoxide hydrolase 1 [Streptomyces sp. WAC 00631]|uniref:epoxide hydrolase family protein n=1 Tax=unclassified Streptomyces TaxID=2593676 RepID=UPI000F77DB0F|nr:MULTISPECIES: epoxide hydrolase [unclassified Streptomyces]MCC5033269.1 epoxide hydrolase 1 [Streptomyces sp. WAC 00631]MCC9741363.1 epoxide hydrolase 1 [Streptomyces sp. MNU89]